MTSSYFILLVFYSTFIIVLGLPIWGIIIVEQIMNFHIYVGVVEFQTMHFHVKE